MKNYCDVTIRLLTLVGLLVLGAATAKDQKKAGYFDSKKAKTHLSKEPVQTKHGMLTKSLIPPKETGRSYNRTKGIVVVQLDNGGELQQAFSPVPILFHVNDVALLGQESKANLRKMATMLRDIQREEPTAEFRIEGHASAEGSRVKNQGLSERRAAEIKRLLQGLSVKTSHLTAQGLGESFAQHPENASDDLLQEDRQVLVVRVE